MRRYETISFSVFDGEPNLMFVDTDRVIDATEFEYYEPWFQSP